MARFLQRTATTGRKRKDRLAEAAFSSRENSSNGSEAVKTFLGKSYEVTPAGVKKFLQDKCLYLQ